MGHEPHGVHGPTGVRRLTPRECERLQGFPDDWTLIPTAASPATRRYAAMGDAVTVPVAQWIGSRLMENY
jgi:DNA (cytosine-5)-methyltransferase 1